MTVTHSASQGWKNKNPLSSSSGQAQYQDLNSFQRKVNILKASSEPNYRNYTLIVQEGGREGGWSCGRIGNYLLERNVNVILRNVPKFPTQFVEMTKSWPGGLDGTYEGRAPYCAGMLEVCYWTFLNTRFWQHAGIIRNFRSK